MCGRYTLTRDLRTLQPRFLFETEEESIVPRYNLAPTQNAPVVVMENKRPVMRTMRWGLIPPWAKDESIGNRLINARSETVHEKPSFRDSLKKRRCLVLADGFYEWQKGGPGGKKTPMRIRFVDDEPFAFAGLWSVWKNDQGQAVETFTIITREAIAVLKPIHDRMPAILRRESELAWLDTSMPIQVAQLAMSGFPAEMIEAYPVSTMVNSPCNDNPDCILPAGV